MLASTILALFAVVPQDPPPTTSVLMDMPLAVMADLPSSELMLSEAEEPLVPLSASDPRMAIGDMIPTLPAGFVIGSFSRGTGALYTRMHSLGHVYPYVVDGGWSFMMVSVSGSNWASGSVFEAEASAPGGSVAGDVYAHILAGSETWFPDAQVGALHKMRDGDDIGIAPLADVDGFFSGYAATDDYVQEADSELGDGTLRMYFTLRHSGTTGSYDDIPQSWGPSGSSYWKRPSTIFVVSHDGSQWDATPSIYKTAAQLGINGWSEICALSVMDPAFFGAPDGAPGIEVLLSTRDPLLTHKLWVIGRWKHPVTSRNVKYKGPLKTESGGIFAVDELKITNRNQQYVEAVCGDDPGDDLGPTSPHHRLRLERTALTEERPVGNPNLDFSLHQLRQLGANSTGTRFRATLQGYVTSNDHYAVLVLHAVGGPVSLGYVSRSVINNEDKQHFDFLLPWISGSGRLLTMSWQVHGSASQLLGESQHFSIRVR